MSTTSELIARTRELLNQPSRENPFHHLSHCFGLSPFEADILVLCAAVEVDPQAADVCGVPTFASAFAALEGTHWDASAPGGPLRRWRLIEVGAAESLIAAPLRIDEWVLHYLMGAPGSDARIAPLLEPVAHPSLLPASYREETLRLARLWTGNVVPPTAVLRGTASADKRAVAAAAAVAAGMNLRLLDSSRIPSAVAECEETLRLLERDAVLHNCAVLIESESEAAQAIAGRLGLPVALAVQAHHARAGRGAEFFTIDRPPADEQQAIWRYALDEETAIRCNGSLERASEQFSFDTLRILDIARRVNAKPEPDLWAECRAEARPLLDGLAQRVESDATWDDLVLPEAALEALRAMIAQVRHQDTVLRRWGFAGAVSRGLGVSALFHGQSGTGKTLAAEVVANQLNLDLYRIDLSQVVSKYIGETEKNLCAVFDAAENTGTVLLFDEADALFGKRSEVRDSHDRYANIEIGYLLQRMEAYRGIALLTTNMRAALDPAFLRRIRFVVHFPFPDQELRRRIWLRIFPSSLPVEALDVEKLARLSLPGGSIRNIALSAAYLAAEAAEPVRMWHLLAAARRECAKLDRAPVDREIGDWV
jgi:AAA+ superfamily predicted ATPase